MPAEIAASKPAVATTGAPPIEPRTIAPASAPEKSEKALPRSASVLRRDSSRRMGVRSSPPPAPPVRPEITRIGVVGGTRSRTSARKVRASPANTSQRPRTRSASQPLGTRRRKMAMPSAAKKRPMSAPAAAARCGR
jgi:hypothetical protein